MLAPRVGYHVLRDPGSWRAVHGAGSDAGSCWPWLGALGYLDAKGGMFTDCLLICKNLE